MLSRTTGKSENSSNNTIVNKTTRGWNCCLYRRSLDSVANGDEVEDSHRDLLAEQTDLERPVQVPAVVVVLDEELQCHLRRDGLVDHLGLPQQRVLRRPRHHYHHRERHQPETCHADATL